MSDALRKHSERQEQKERELRAAIARALQQVHERREREEKKRLQANARAFRERREREAHKRSKQRRADQAAEATQVRQQGAQQEKFFSTAAVPQLTARQQRELAKKRKKKQASLREEQRRRKQREETQVQRWLTSSFSKVITSVRTQEEQRSKANTADEAPLIVEPYRVDNIKKFNTLKVNWRIKTLNPVKSANREQLIAAPLEFCEQIKKYVEVDFYVVCFEICAPDGVSHSCKK